MQVEITGRNIEITDAIRDKINEKLKQLTHHFDRIISAHVVCQTNSSGQHVEANLLVPGSNLIASAHADDMYTSIDQLGKKLMQQIEKYKTKHANH